MKYNLPEKDKEKIRFLVNLGSLVLKNLELRFTRSFLQETITHSYFHMLQPQPLLVNDNLEERSIIDKEDASNLAIALLEALKKYGIKNEVVDTPAFSKTTVNLVILSKDGSNTVYHELLGIVEAIEGNVIVIQTKRQQENHVVNLQQVPVENYVMLSKTEFSEEPDYVITRKKERTNSLATVVITTLLSAAVIGATWNGWISYPLNWWTPFIVIASLGILICYQLFRLEKNNAASSFVKKVCSAGQGTSSCQRVLFSKASKLFGLVSMTDTGCIYFCSVLAAWLDGLLNNTLPLFLPVLFWWSMITLPYTLFSLYYQVKVIKTVCLLCLSVLLLLWLQALFFLLIVRETDVFLLRGDFVIRLLIIVTAIALLYFLYVQIIRYRNDNFKYSLTNEELKCHTGLFNTLWANQPDFPPINAKGELIMGNPASPVSLTFILSTTCTPCARKLRDIDTILDWFNHEICIRVFIKPDPASGEFVKTFLHFITLERFSEAKALIAEWFAFLSVQKKEKKSTNRFSKERLQQASLYNHVSPEIEDIYIQNEKWYNDHPIPHTPFILYNNKALPFIYYERDTLISVIEQQTNTES